MYLVTLMTIRVLMLARPKSSVKNPSTWGHRAEPLSPASTRVPFSLPPPFLLVVVALLTRSRRRILPPKRPAGSGN